MDTSIENPLKKNDINIFYIIVLMGEYVYMHAYMCVFAQSEGTTIQCLPRLHPIFLLEQDFSLHPGLTFGQFC